MGDKLAFGNGFELLFEPGEVLFGPFNVLTRKVRCEFALVFSYGEFA